MRSVCFAFVLSLGLWACGAVEPTPAIFDLVDGTVRTHMETQEPLPHWQEAGYTQLMLVPTPEAGAGEGRRSLSEVGRRISSAVSTYSMGFMPEVVLAPDNQAGRYAANGSASINGLPVNTYSADLSAQDLASKLSAHPNARVLLMGEPETLIEALRLASASEEDVAWPPEGREAFVYAAYGSGTLAVRPYAIKLEVE